MTISRTIVDCLQAFVFHSSIHLNILIYRCTLMSSRMVRLYQKTASVAQVKNIQGHTVTSKLLSQSTQRVKEKEHVILWSNELSIETILKPYWSLNGGHGQCGFFQQLRKDVAWPSQASTWEIAASPGQILSPVVPSEDGPGIDNCLRMFEVGLWRAFFPIDLRWFKPSISGSFAVTPKLCDNLSPFVSFPASLVGHKRTKEGLKISSGVGYHLGKHENNGWTYWWGAIHCSSLSAAQLIQQYFLSIRHTIYTCIYIYIYASDSSNSMEEWTLASGNLIFELYFVPPRPGRKKYLTEWSSSQLVSPGPLPKPPQKFPLNLPTKIRTFNLAIK